MVAEFCFNNISQLLDEQDEWKIIEVIKDGNVKDISEKLIYYHEQMGKYQEEVDTLEEKVGKLQRVESKCERLR